MPSPKTTYDLPSGATSHVVKEEQVECGFIGKLQSLKYECRARHPRPYDIYQPAEMVDDNKQLFRQILGAFLGRYEFALPDIFGRPVTKAKHTP